MTESWKRFLTLYAIQFIQLLDFISITATGALFVADHKIQSSTISYSLGAYSVMAIIGSVIINRFRAYGPKRNLLFLLSVFVCSQILLAVHVNDFFFIASRIVGGLTGGLMGSIAYSQLGAVDSQNAGLWNGRIQTAQSMVTLIGLPLCLLAVSQLGTRPYFLIMTVLTIGVIAQLSKSNFLKASPAPTSHPFSVDSLTKHSDIIFSGFLCYLAAFLFISQMPNYLVNVRHISSSELSVAYSVSGVLTLLLSGYIGKLGDKVNSKILLLASASVIIIAQAIFLGEFNPYWTLYLGLPLYLILSTARAIYQRGLILQKHAEDSVTMHLINNVSIRTGILLSGLLLGLISANEKDIGVTFRIANYSSAACGIIIILWLIFGFSLKRLESSRIKQ